MRDDRAAATPSSSRPCVALVPSASAPAAVLSRAERASAMDCCCCCWPAAAMRCTLSSSWSRSSAQCGLCRGSACARRTHPPLLTSMPDCCWSTRRTSRSAAHKSPRYSRSCLQEWKIRRSRPPLYSDPSRLEIALGVRVHPGHERCGSTLQACLAFIVRPAGTDCRASMTVGAMASGLANASGGTGALDVQQAQVGGEEHVVGARC